MEISIRDEENSPSGLWRTLGKRVGCKPSRVRIPYSPRGQSESKDSVTEAPPGEVKLAGTFMFARLGF